MEQAKKAKLEAAGIDVEEALQRFLGNEELFLKFLGRFPQDENYRILWHEVEEEHWDMAVNAAHTLKGVTGNLSITPLYQLFSAQVEAFRGGHPQEAVAMMDEIGRVYQRISQAIEEAND